MFSIIIPTFNNLEYLKICINSIKKNSKFDHDLIVHINEGKDGTLDYIKTNNIAYTYSDNNIGLCSAVNQAASNAKTNYILYSHDDMYFCPNWDIILKNELDSLDTKLFYLSASMIEQHTGHIKLDCGSDFNNFNEKKLLANYNNKKFYDFQGSHWAPHLIHKDLWIKIAGFSEEFNPGAASDPDLNMKLWKERVRIFKGIADFRVYHFGSISLRKKSNFKKNNGTKTFLKKWGITPKFFKKHYLKSDTSFEGPLSEPVYNLNFLIGLLVCKIKLLFLLIKNE